MASAEIIYSVAAYFGNIPPLAMLLRGIPRTIPLRSRVVHNYTTITAQSPARMCSRNNVTGNARVIFTSRVNFGRLRPEEYTKKKKKEKKGKKKRKERPSDSIINVYNALFAHILHGQMNLWHARVTEGNVIAFLRDIITHTSDKVT